MGSTFSGMGCWEIAAAFFGIQPLFAVEKGSWIARIYARNFGDHVLGVDQGAEAVDAYALPGVDLLVASPPCQLYSKSGKAQATRRKRAGIEKSINEDFCSVKVGLEVLRYAHATQPSVVLLEEAPDYAKAKVFGQIVQGLRAMGYTVDWKVLNAEDHGSPSARKRLIMRAAVGRLPAWPKKEPPVDWWAALQPVLHTMEPKALAPWQARSLDHDPPPSLPALIAGGNPTKLGKVGGKTVYRVWRVRGQPAWTVQRGPNSSGTRLILPDGAVLKMSAEGQAALMGIPPGYDWGDAGYWAITSVVGNALPPPLAARIIAPFVR